MKNSGHHQCVGHADDEKPWRGFNCGKPCVQPRERLNVGIVRQHPIYRTLEGFGRGNRFACEFIITTEPLQGSYIIYALRSPG